MIQLLPTSLLGLLPLLAQTDYETTAPAAPSPIFWVCYFAVIILLIAAMWKVFTKAGQPGWAAIIPIFNMYILCKVAGRPGWWVILLLIPFVNFIILIILSIDVAKSFGKGAGFGIGLFFLPFIFYPILGFGSAQYQGGGSAAPQTI
jgi:hypothetical protein